MIIPKTETEDLILSLKIVNRLSIKLAQNHKKHLNLNQHNQKKHFFQTINFSWF